MGSVFVKILCMLAIMAIGYFIKRIGLVKQSDFHSISNIIIYVTVPASVLINFNGFKLDPSMLMISVLAIVFFFIASGLSLRLTRSQPKDERAFVLLNSTAYNTGAFTLAFIQALLPPACAVTVTVFDIGNCSTTAVFCYMLASMVLAGKTHVTPRYVIHRLTHSFVFMVYMTVTVVGLLEIPIPRFLLAPAELIAPANVFLAMLAVGIGMEINMERSELRTLLKCLGVRYAMAVPLALVSWFLLPFDENVRLAMVLVSFSPSTLFGALYTAALGGNYPLANTVISVSIMISTAIMTLLVMLLG